jgi:hypothetical protein
MRLLGRPRLISAWDTIYRRLQHAGDRPASVREVALLAALILAIVWVSTKKDRAFSVADPPSFGHLIA